MFKTIGYLLILCLSKLAFAAPSANALTVCPAFPFFLPQEGTLATINCDFHHLYEKRIAEIIATFGAKGGRPVILNLGGRMIFKHDGKIETANITPPAFHEIKAFSHAVFSVFLILANLPSGDINEQDEVELWRLQNNLQKALAELPQMSIPPKTKKAIEHLAMVTHDFIKSIINQKHVTSRELDRFFERSRPEIKKLIYAASFMELSALHKTLNSWLAKLSPNELQRLGVVLAVSHQARAREITLQYFAKRFGFKYSEGALLERGFVVMEDKFDEKSAQAMLARHYLDRAVAKVILNDANGLQADLLSGATHAILFNCFNNKACPLLH